MSLRPKNLSIFLNKISFFSFKVKNLIEYLILDTEKVQTNLDLQQ